MLIVNQADVTKLIEIDDTFKKIKNQYGLPPNWKRPEGFVSLSKIILEQQISLESAAAHFNKLNNYVKNFTPENIIKLSDSEMRDNQISKQKSIYLRVLSDAVLNKTILLDELNKQSTQKIREELTKIKGIGNWTADVYIIFCLQRKDIFPVGDIALIKAANELWGTLNAKEVQELSVSWSPYRSLASFFLWHHYLSKRKRIITPEI